MPPLRRRFLLEREEPELEDGEADDSIDALAAELTELDAGDELDSLEAMAAALDGDEASTPSSPPAAAAAAAKSPTVGRGRSKTVTLSRRQTW